MKYILTLILSLPFTLTAFGQQAIPNNHKEIQKMIIGTWINERDSATHYKLYIYDDSIICSEIKTVFDDNGKKGEELYLRKYTYSIKEKVESPCGYQSVDGQQPDWSLYLHEYFPVYEDYGECAPIYSLDKTTLKINHLGYSSHPVELTLKKINK